MVFLDELWQGRKYYRKRISSTNDAFDKGTLIAKYLFSIGMNKYEVESELYRKFKNVYAKIFDETESRKRTKYMTDVAEKSGMPGNISISFNQAELDLINSQEEDIKILLMVMMCMYKYFGGEFKATSIDIHRYMHIPKLDLKHFHPLFTRFMEMGFFNSYVKLEKRYDVFRYNIYFKPSEELLAYTKMGSYVVMIDDFRNLWIRIRQILGYENKYCECKDCGAICISRSHSNIQIRCEECRIEFNKKAEKEWKERTGWVHPHSDPNSEFYYISRKKKKESK